MQYSAINWRAWKDGDTAYRRAGGRRRYNAMRQDRAMERQSRLIEAVNSMGLAAWLFPRGLPQALAGALGVHPTTVWRDMCQVLWHGQETEYVNSEGEILFSVRRAYPGGRVLAVFDAAGRPIRGAERGRIVRRLPRYHGRR